MSNPTLNPKSHRTELTLAFYNAARAEILQRLSLREQTLLAWITTAGVIVGIALRNGTADPTLVEVIPILSLPFAAVIYRHDRIVSYIATSYIKGELSGFLRQSEALSPRHWDNSRTVEHKMALFQLVEVFIHLVFLIGLPVVCLGYTYWVLRNAHRLSAPLFWIGLAFTSAVLVVGVKKFLERYRKYKKSKQRFSFD